MVIAAKSMAALVLSCGIFALAGETTAGDRPAEQILKELDALQRPRPDATKQTDPTYLQEFLPKRNEVLAKRAALILELYKVAPRHERTAKLMGERWAHIVGPFPKSLDSLKVIDEILAKDTSPQLKIEGTFYAKYHDQGVEFIGVSVDRPENEGGLASLKKFVEEKAIPWPQFYDGGTGRFTNSWGIQFIPTLFVDDAEGKLYATDAQGKLEAIIPELLQQRSSQTRTSAD